MDLYQIGGVAFGIFCLLYTLLYAYQNFLKLPLARFAQRLRPRRRRIYIQYICGTI